MYILHIHAQSATLHKATTFCMKYCMYCNTACIIGASVSEPLLCRCQWRSCTYVCPRSTATRRMCERCSNSADLAGFGNQQLLVQEISVRVVINRSPKIPRLRKRQHSAPGSLSQLSPREAERLRDGYDSTPDPAYSCLRCSAQRQTATWLLYRVLYSLLAGCSVCHFAHARPTMPSISLVILHVF